MTWKDVSSWSRSDTVRTPKTWEASASGMRIVITRHRDYPPDAWILRCSEVGLDLLQLMAVDLEEAQLEALGLVRGRLKLWLASVEMIERAAVAAKGAEG